MMTVAIMVNGHPIFTRSAVNIGPVKGGTLHRYKVDDGSIVTHRREDGALPLARKLLQRIREPLPNK